MIKVYLLESELKKQQKVPNDLANALNISYQSLNKRMRGKVDFRLEEIRKIKKFLNLSLEQTDNIFLQEN